MYTLLRNLILVTINAILALALLLFASGFFPYKAFIPGLAQWPEDIGRVGVDAPFDRVIFMVIDALRSDFVFSNASHFQFTQSLVRKGAALPFTGHASSPTITMPRVKAITTGSVPSFVDLILNFAESDDTSTLATQDSWLAQLRAGSDRGLVMYGDDTWLRLFPDFFERADGTTSFFVSDFTEVDNNVTRHVPEELIKEEWSAMIMHYLGLDHIGHKTGPQRQAQLGKLVVRALIKCSPHMAPKQTEMDGIVHQIYSAMEIRPHLKSSLLVLCGDHGMNEAGNHGGSAPGETSTALVFISPKFTEHFRGYPCPTQPDGDYGYYDTVEQSDLVPTLAALLGFPIPLNNLGVMIPQALDLWQDDKRKIDILQANVLQILDIARGTFPSPSRPSPASSLGECEGTETEKLLCEGEQIACGRPPKAAKTMEVKSELQIRLEWLRKAQTALSGTASNYSLNRMFFGLSLSFVVLVAVAVMSYPVLRRAGSPGLAFASTLLAHGVMHFASSYVEEEQQFWYWVLSGWLFYLFTKQQRNRISTRYPRGLIVFAISILFRLGRHWNQTGQKFAGEPDIVAFLSQHVVLLWFLVTASYAVPSRRLCRAATKWVSMDLSLVPVPVTMVALLFKITFATADAPELLSGIDIIEPLTAKLKTVSLATQARAVFLGLVLLLALALFGHTFDPPNTDNGEGETRDSQSPRETPSIHSTIHNILTLLLLTQSRPTNIPLFLIFTIQHSLLRTLDLSRTSLTLTSLLLQQSSFFALGNSNAISSIDLSNAYNGVTSYHVLAVGFLTLLSNWAGPVFWVSATAELRAAARARAGARVTRSFSPLRSDNERSDDEGSLRPSPSAAALATTPSTAIFAESFMLSTLGAAASTAAVMAACMALREHLFVWTVFSPKYLFSAAWVVGHHFLFEGVLGLGLGLMGS